MQSFLALLTGALFWTRSVPGGGHVLHVCRKFYTDKKAARTNSGRCARIEDAGPVQERVPSRNEHPERVP